MTKNNFVADVTFKDQLICRYEVQELRTLKYFLKIF